MLKSSMISMSVRMRGANSRPTPAANARPEARTLIAAPIL
jgi:hypothetical protein